MRRLDRKEWKNEYGVYFWVEKFEMDNGTLIAQMWDKQDRALYYWRDDFNEQPMYDESKGWVFNGMPLLEAKEYELQI